MGSVMRGKRGRKGGREREGRRDGGKDSLPGHLENSALGWHRASNRRAPVVLIQSVECLGAWATWVGFVGSWRDRVSHMQLAALAQSGELGW